MLSTSLLLNTYDKTKDSKIVELQQDKRRYLKKVAIYENQLMSFKNKELILIKEQSNIVAQFFNFIECSINNNISNNYEHNIYNLQSIDFMIEYLNFKINRIYTERILEDTTDCCNKKDIIISKNNNNFYKNIQNKSKTINNNNKYKVNYEFNEYDEDIYNSIK